MVVEKVEVKGGSVFRKEKSQVFGKKIDLDTVIFWKEKIRYLKFKKGINRKNFGIQCYQFSLSNTKGLSIASIKNYPLSKLHPI